MPKTHRSKSIAWRKTTLTWPDAYAKQHNPIEKQATDITKNTRGDRLIQISTHQGTRWPGERLRFPRVSRRKPKLPAQFTHYIACFQVSPSRLLTAAAMLKTMLRNQKQLTETATGSWGDSPYENCRVVAVTAEKKVATVDRLRRFVAPCFCANRMVGTPTQNFTTKVYDTEDLRVPISMNIDRVAVMLSMCSPISDARSWIYRCTAGNLNWPGASISTMDVIVDMDLRTLIFSQTGSPILLFMS